MTTTAMWLALVVALPSLGWSARVQVPPLTGPVVDQADLISAKDEAAIATALARFREQTGNQLQVLTVESLAGVPIEELSIRVVEKWQLGSANKDNGVLLLVAEQEREWRIEVGGGLEGDLPDAVASRIGRELLVPRFRRGDYTGGIVATLDAVAGMLGGELQLGQVSSSGRGAGRGRSSGGFVVFLIAALFMLFVGRGRGGGLLAGLLLGSMLGGGRRGGFGGGFGGGGGGWSGGGGGFSGGGASGGW